jgi:hypothetical protein
VLVHTELHIESEGAFESSGSVQGLRIVDLSTTNSGEHMSKFSRVVSAGLLVMASAGAAGAAECGVFEIPFPTVGEHARDVTGSCTSILINRATGTGFHSTAGDPNTKSIAGKKNNGNQTSFVHGVNASNVPMSSCAVMVNNPADPPKKDVAGCLAAVKVRLRMFD